MKNHKLDYGSTRTHDEYILVVSLPKDDHLHLANQNHRPLKHQVFETTKANLVAMSSLRTTEELEQEHTQPE